MSHTGTSEFNSQDPFQSLAMRNEGILPPPPIVRIEGWQNYVQRPNAVRPAMPSIDEFAAMQNKEKKEFAKQRKKYHAEMPLLETPALSRIHADSIRLAAMNYSSPPGARMGIVLDGLGTVGKSSTAMELGKKYELSWRKNILPRIQGGNFSRPIPVVYVTLTGVIAINDFNRLITSFMGISVPESAKTSWLSNRIIDATQECGTSLIIIDDIHFLQMRNRTAQTVNNHLKSLASCVSATFVYAGINVEGSGLLAEGKSKEKAFASQTQHRFKTFPIFPFAKTSSDFKALLSTFEASLALMNQPLGTLAGMSDFIHDRTGGFMGAISNLIREGANIAIDNGSEKLSQTLLEKVKLAFASEAHQNTTTSKKRD
ncbi:MAG: ATP-binding protein [Pseudomonadota bacterium]|nr:ATP-binding protein [Pseudomonadota bacterium]